MKYCIHCGAAINENMAFCINCGAKLIKDEVKMQGAQSQGQQPAQPQNSAAQNSFGQPVIAALSELGISKEEAIYVGDSDVDFETAKNSGLPCISVLWGFRDKEFLIEHGAQNFAEKPAEISRLIEAGSCDGSAGCPGGMRQEKDH